jgi:ribulose-phosphate 3-epimerase
MNPVIVPAILIDKKEEFIRMLEVCKTFTDYVQVDIMDARFVPSKSITASDLSGIETPLKIEAHLMVDEPLAWLDSFKRLGAFRVIFHYEIKKDIEKVIHQIKQEGMEAAVALNPETKVKELDKMIASLDSVLFLSVNPGFYGAKFIPKVLEKVKEFKQRYPKKIAGIDGGIKFENVKEIAKTGVDYICIGSAILKENFPKQAYLKIKEALNE